MSSLLLSTSSVASNQQCLLVSKYTSSLVQIGSYEVRSKYTKKIHRYPALIVPGNADDDVIIFGNLAVCQFMFGNHYNNEIKLILEALENILSLDEDLNQLKTEIEKLEHINSLNDLEIHCLYPWVVQAFNLLGKPASYSKCCLIIRSIETKPYFNEVIKSSRGGIDIINLESYDWASAGLLSSLQTIFTHSIRKAFPDTVYYQLDQAAIARCNNPNHGDFQCNNALALGKAFKQIEGYTGSCNPKDIAEIIIKCMPSNPFIQATSTAPNGFINITLNNATLASTISDIVQNGVKPPKSEKLKILVDFSSPNIAKEMHVGHLRSTIIGDSICKMLELCGHDVMRVNHVGDWGTQFGMLITYLCDHPENLSKPQLDISEITVWYKESKKRFDESDEFKERSRGNVVKLQAGDVENRKKWELMCEISRIEFQRIYDALKIKLTEVGESFYNPYIPDVIKELSSIGLIQQVNGMSVISLPHFTIPLILQKSDGGYGYDSTDMAALNYRLKTLNRDWIIYVTDLGQADHFHMCFDAAREAGWLNHQKLNHIGFGVVQGDDGKRFRTRATDTVKLIDLLNTARDTMMQSLQSRISEGKSSLSGEELVKAAASIGYGAVKYFDLKQNPSSNYIFSFDRMLDVKGDTAVYLMFAYARLISIVKKGADEKSLHISDLIGTTTITLDHPAERALAFELLQFGDALQRAIRELTPNTVCDYLKELCIKFTDFVTKCHVLNSPETKSRLLLCEAARKVMLTCFHLLGIDPVERI